MKKKKSKLINLGKETPEARKKRASSGVKFRAVVFENTQILFSASHTADTPRVRIRRGVAPN